ncbi:MAG: M18 family aminopeptidase, partial [Candidatus Marinimicrobia bacterium]|nr:M18 family aminopeptidase [Candidatus Neomarinimicrobiota bacterium]
MSLPLITDLINYLDQSVTAYHAVITTEKELQSRGFQKLNEQDQWTLQPNNKYYVIRGESALLAWQMGQGDQVGVRLIGAHTDSPGLHLKPNAQYSKEGYIQLGVEVYGGPLLASWTDRDLSLAGRVIINAAGKLKITAFRSDRVLLRVPQLAIHLNREVNDKGLLLNKQKHMPPILALDNGDGEPLDVNLVRRLIAEELGVDQDTIINWQLECYDTQSAQLSGLNNEFLVSGRIDNLTMCHAALTALTQDEFDSPQTSMIALFDNEEIGSATQNGAASAFIRDIIHRVIDTSDTKHALHRGLARSICISADGAHAIHPNYGEYHDPQHAVKLNRGPVIKVNANHRYATSALTSAIFEQLGRDVNVPL